MKLAPGRRPAFSLIELLVVIFIIGILMSLTAGGVMQVMEVQRGNTTTDNLQTLAEILRKQWDKVVKDADTEVNLPAAVYNFAGGDAARAKVIWRNVRLMEAFPVSYAEITNPLVYNPNFPSNGAGPLIPVLPANKRKYMATYQVKLGGRSSVSPTQSAACLLLALSINRGGVKLDPDKASTADTDGDGMKELIDAWGNALTFYRFPTGSADLQAANPSPASKFCDPLDPTGTLANTNWTNQNLFAQSIHPIFFQGNQLPTVYTIPVIVSSGHNGILGLDPTMAITDQNGSNDNIYSYRLRQGGGAGQ
jgi:prepilin-type N-terminal cleavage/methylation domain-containing protein